MTKQPAPARRSRATVIAAVLAVIVAAGAFGAAFYVFDGSALVGQVAAPLLSLFGLGPSETTSPNPQPAPVTPADTLTLPKGMPESFALRVWLEQVESQANIERLVTGDVKTLEALSAKVNGASSVVAIRVTFADGTVLPGELGMRKFGGAWYVAWVRGLRTGQTPVLETDEAHALPARRDVDVKLLSEVLAQQASSNDLLAGYATGLVQRADVTTVTEGPGTATLELKITEKDKGVYPGKLVAIQDESGTEPRWFIARFARTAAK